MKYITVLTLALLIISCKKEPQVETLTAEGIINKSIKVSGDSLFQRSKIAFDFRDKHYEAIRNDGQFDLIRTFISDEDSIKDVLTNSGFERFVNSTKMPVADSMAIKYSASVNSVHYFSILPYGLNDKAVNKTLIGEDTIKGKAYHLIKVTFSEEGGGEDYEDVFLYWVNKSTHKVDYLAYSYNEDDGLGVRFREAYNERYVEGLRFVDYNNYKPADEDHNLFELGRRFDEDSLKLVSKIELKQIKVHLIHN